MANLNHWSDAERLAAHWMRQWGYGDARTTNRGADGGVDVRSSWAIAQVKFQGSQTGRPHLQRLFGAREHQTQLHMFFFSRSGYSRDAIAYANGVGMVLFTFRADGAVEPANAIASQFLDNVARTQREAEEAWVAQRRAARRAATRGVPTGRVDALRESAPRWLLWAAVLALIGALYVFFDGPRFAAGVLVLAAVGLCAASVWLARRGPSAGPASAAGYDPCQSDQPSTESRVDPVGDVSPRVAIAMGDQLMEAGDAAGAEAAYRLASDSPDTRISAKALLRIGGLRMAAGHYDEAHSWYGAAADLNHPDVTPRALLAIADLHERLGERSDAIDVLTSVSELDHPRHSPEALRRLAALRPPPEF